jgi:hypothetical protein
LVLGLNKYKYKHLTSTHQWIQPDFHPPVNSAHLNISGFCRLKRSRPNIQHFTVAAHLSGQHKRFEFMVAAHLSSQHQRFNFMVAVHLSSQHQRFNTFMVAAGTKNQHVIMTHFSNRHQYCALFVVPASYKSGSHARYFAYRLQLSADTIKMRGCYHKSFFISCHSHMHNK